MEEDEVGARKERIERHIVRDGAPLVRLGAAVGDDVHVQRAQDARGGSADAPKSDDARGLAADLDEGTLPIAKIDAGRPFARMDGAVMMPDLRARLEEECDCILTYIVRTVAGYIHDIDILFACIGSVDCVVSRSEYGNGTQVRTGVHGCGANRRLVDDDDLGVADAFADARRFVVRCAVVDREVAERREGRPADVARILRISVQNNDLHAQSSYEIVSVIFLLNRIRRCPHSVLLFHVFPRLADDDAREGEQGDEVRDRHESVHDVGENPDRLEF